jgi:hypothetical protein
VTITKLNDLTIIQKRRIMAKYGGQAGRPAPDGGGRTAMISTTARALKPPVSPKAVSLVFWGKSTSARIEAALVAFINQREESKQEDRGAVPTPRKRKVA